MAIPIVICIDAEPDAQVFSPDAPSPLSGLEQMLKASEPLRARLRASTGRPVHFAWSLRMDPQIAMGYGSPTFLAEKYPMQLDALAAYGDAIGVHPHAWRWDAGRHLTVAAHDDSHYVEDCMEMAVKGFQATFGRVPDYHRYGAHFMSTPTMNLLRDMGVIVDLTVEPGEPPVRDVIAGVVWTGNTGDFRNAPNFAYQPDPQDYLRPAMAAETLWELPLTSGIRPATQLFSDPLHSFASRLQHPVRSARNLQRRANARYTGAAKGPSHRHLPIGGDWKKPADFWAAAWAAARALERPYLAFAIRTNPGSTAKLTNMMNALMMSDRIGELSFVTPAEALAQMGLA
jgi:hypothetical protein